MSFGQFDAGSDKSEYNAISFLIEQAMLKMQTVTLVKVIAVHSNGVGITGTVDVQPMVNQMQAGPNGTQTAIAHGTIYGVPFFRLQGGLSAFICDPVDGDIGLCGFAARDISSVKQTRAVANPGSQRTYDWADGLYVGGFINGVPTQYIQALASAGGWKIVTPGDITLESPLTEVTGDLKVDGDTTLEGELSVTGTSTFTGAMATAALTSSGVITAAGFSGPGGTSPAGPPGPAGPTGPTGPAFLDVTGPGGFSLTGVTNAAFAGSGVTVTGSGTSITITITGGGGGGSITDITGSSFITVTNGTGPTVGVDLSSSFQAAYAATAALAVAADALAATALQPITGLGGSYTNADITLNSAGQITAASNGSGGGGSSLFNVTPDVHPANPTSTSGNTDEFESGTAIDTAGTRYAGAVPWAVIGPNTGFLNSAVADGSVTIGNTSTGSVNTSAVYGQAIASASSPWTFNIKMDDFNQAGGTYFAGAFVGDATSGAGYFFGFYTGLGGNVLINTQVNWAAGNSGNVYNASLIPYVGAAAYLQINYDGTNLNFFTSVNGVRWLPVFSVPVLSLIGGPPDTIGMFSGGTSNQTQVISFDYFRRIL